MILRRDIFQAVADPTRRAILALLAAQTLTAGTIADNFNNARSTVSKHIQILTECGLVKARPEGREIYYELQIEKMAEIDFWTAELHKIWNSRLDRLDQYLSQIQNQKA